MNQLQPQPSNLFFQPFSAASGRADRSDRYKFYLWALTSALFEVCKRQAKHKEKWNNGRSWCDATEREIIDGITDPTRRRS